jgi:anti-sigma factor RsiW
MDCNETRPLLDADIDGELDLVRHLELEAHLRTCPDCARLAENARARHIALRESLPRFAAPSQLAEKIRAALPAAPVEQVRETPKSAKMLFPLWQITGLAASLAFAVLAGFAWGNARARANLLVDDAIAEHVRSLQVNHLTDVTSTDQHTVKPWFAGKLDFSPPVVDLAAVGFPLTGGRLDHLAGRPAASLVFHRRQHAINLFIWPAAAMDTQRSQRNGYNTEAWSQAGLNFLAVSDIPAAELAEFAKEFRTHQP